MDGSNSSTVRAHDHVASDTVLLGLTGPAMVRRRRPGRVTNGHGKRPMRNIDISDATPHDACRADAVGMHHGPVTPAIKPT